MGGEYSLKPSNSGLHKSLMGPVFIWLALRSFLCPGETLYVLEENNSNSISCVIRYLQVIPRILALSAVNKRPPIHNVSGLFQTPHLSRWHPQDGRGWLSPYVAGGSSLPRQLRKCKNKWHISLLIRTKCNQHSAVVSIFWAFLRSKNEMPNNRLCLVSWGRKCHDIDLFVENIWIIPSSLYHIQKQKRN